MALLWLKMRNSVLVTIKTIYKLFECVNIQIIALQLRSIEMNKQQQLDIYISSRDVSFDVRLYEKMRWNVMWNIMATVQRHVCERD